MPEQYTKKLNISLTAADYKYLQEAAAKDRRSTAQYGSILIERAIANSKGNDNAK